MAYQAGEFDVIVIGAGHAGIEASLAAARMGSKTVMLTMNPDMVGFMYCNPSIGGPAKGIVVREIDALGGEMARAIDATYIQMKMLNTSKGPAVRALRAQADKFEYQNRMKKALEDEPNLLLRQALVERLIDRRRYVCRRRHEYRSRVPGKSGHHHDRHIHARKNHHR